MIVDLGFPIILIDEMEVPSSNHPLQTLISNYLRLTPSPTDFEEDEPKYRPTSYSPPASPTLFSLALMSLDPHIDALPLLNSKFSPTDDSEENRSNEKGHSETALECLFPVPFAFLPDAEERRRHAEIALKHYNKENASNYHLVDTFLSNGMSLWYGTWLHCNFTAKPPTLDISPKLFFAEICGATLTVKECFFLEGETVVGCNLCSNVVHSAYRFLDEHHKIDRQRFSPDIPYTLPDAEKRRMHAEIAVEYYNKNNAANYEVVDAFLSNGVFLWSITYFHCNFTAKPSNSDISPKLFFAEICEDTLRVVTCVILEGNTFSGCEDCSNVIHPTHGFICGKPNIKKLDWPALPFSPTPHYQPYPALPFSPYNINFAGEAAPPFHPKTFPPAPVYSNPHRRFAETAMFKFNRRNGTEYEFVDTLRCCDLLSEGIWYHLNFTAKQPSEDTSPKLFFAEIVGSTRGATACLMLEGQTTTDGCIFCSEIVHPTHGFVQGLPKSDVRTQPRISV